MRLCTVDEPNPLRYLVHQALTDRVDHIYLPQGNHQAKSATTIALTGSTTSSIICVFGLIPEPLSPPLAFVPLPFVLVCEGLVEVSEECELEVVEAPFERGADCPVATAPNIEVLGVSAATGIVEEPAGAVDVAVTAAPSHKKAMALTPLGPSK